jgi:DNA-binding transcriptional LysR family regulator
VDVDVVRMFVKVAELASFTRAAEHLGLSKARVSTAVQALETEVGSRLLQRSMRAVRLTTSGEATDAPSFEYQDGTVYRERPTRSLITVNSSDAYNAACILGLGIIQAPRAGMLPAIAVGDLVEILPQLTCEPMPVSLVHPHGRNVPGHVRVVMNWIAELLKPQLA